MLKTNLSLCKSFIIAMNSIPIVIVRRKEKMAL